MADDSPRALKYVHWFFSSRSFRDEFWSIFGDTISNFSSNIRYKGKPFNSFYILSHFWNNCNSDVYKPLYHSIPSWCSYILYYFHSSYVVYNYKLFTIARKSRRNNEMKKSFSLKNISCCLLVIACLMALSIPSFIYIVLRLISKEKENTLDSAQVAGLWAITAASMNSTFNCLIFYWKNKILRSEGMKVIRSMKIRRRAESCSVHTEQPDNNRIWRKEGCLTLTNEKT